MITLKISFEYGCFPVWMYDEFGRLIDNALPDELCVDKQILTIFSKLQKLFDSTFVDNEKEFYGKGFSNKEERTFHNLLNEAIQILEKKCGGRYRIVNNLC